MAACNPFTEDQMSEMLASRAFGSGSRARNQALFIMECTTGGRVGELLGLRLRDVLDANGALRSSITFTKTKNGDSRTVQVVNPLYRLFILPWLLEVRDSGNCLRTDRLFPSPRPDQSISRNRVYSIYKTAAAQLGYTGTFGTHSCRKTWARDVYRYYQRKQMQGEPVDPLLKLKEAGGWRTIEAASRYLDFMLGDTRAAQRALYPSLQAKYVGETGFKTGA